MKYLLLLLAIAPALGQAGVYEDCILQNMKGVQLQSAVVEVRRACEQKQEEENRRRVFELGEPLDKGSFKAAPSWELDSQGMHAMQFTNTNADKTITYVRLRVSAADASAKTCDGTKGKVYAYKITTKPNEKIRLIYPSAENLECVTVEGLLGRSPSWTDISFSTSAAPASKDPLAGID